MTEHRRALAAVHREAVGLIYSLLEEGHGWIVTWAAATVLAARIIGLALLQRACFGHCRHRKLIGRLDGFVLAVAQRFAPAEASALNTQHEQRN
jgi:hypothetical protein